MTVPKLLARCWVAVGVACAAVPTPDPVTHDPVEALGEHPVRMAELSVESHGASLNGIAYLARGAGPHPTVMLLHGYPGYERNLDLAQALRRAGWNVLFVHYRGAWGSGGEFSLEGALADAARVLEVARSAEFAKRHRIDPDRIVPVGHSMGGFVALMTASTQERVWCVVSMAGANLGLLGVAAAQDPERAAAAARAVDGWSGPIRGGSGAGFVDAAIANAGAWNLLDRAATLASKRVLLVGALEDADTPLAVHHTPLVEALRAADARLVREVVLPTDHSFSERRIALARHVVTFLDEECRHE